MVKRWLGVCGCVLVAIVVSACGGVDAEAGDDGGASGGAGGEEARGGAGCVVDESGNATASLESLCAEVDCPEYEEIAELKTCAVDEDKSLRSGCGVIAYVNLWGFSSSSYAYDPETHALVGARVSHDLSWGECSAPSYSTPDFGCSETTNCSLCRDREDTCDFWSDTACEVEDGTATVTLDELCAHDCPSSYDAFRMRDCKEGEAPRLRQGCGRIMYVERVGAGQRSYAFDADTPRPPRRGVYGRWGVGAL